MGNPRGGSGAFPPAAGGKPTGAGSPPGAGAPSGGGTPGYGETTEEPVLPEYVLVRLIDVTIEPGKTYGYRMRIKAANPNFQKINEVVYKGIADKAELVSPPVEVTEPLIVPPDLNYYAVDQKELEKIEQKDPKTKSNKPRFRTAPDLTTDKERVAVQIHRWVDYAYPTGPKNPAPVGDWLVAERVLAHRGEYLRRRLLTEVPIWYVAK